MRLTLLSGPCKSKVDTITAAARDDGVQDMDLARRTFLESSMAPDGASTADWEVGWG